MVSYLILVLFSCLQEEEHTGLEVALHEDLNDALDVNDAQVRVLLTNAEEDNGETRRVDHGDGRSNLIVNLYGRDLQMDEGRK